MKFGKLAPKLDPRTLRFEAYYGQDGSLPLVPAGRDWQRGIPYDADPLGNINVGDCVYAARGHLVDLASRLAGLPSPVTAERILAEYGTGTGWDPAVPGSDRGAYLLDALKDFRKVGCCGVRCEAFVAVEPQNLAAAIALFGGAIVGLSMPSTIWQQDIWDDVGAPGDAGGHAVFLHSESPGLWVGNSWGLRKPITPRFLERYCDEAYAVLLADRIAPSGLNLEALRADLARL